MPAASPIQADKDDPDYNKRSTKSSAYRGVTLFRPTMKWRAQISANGKTTSLGDHDTEELAARAFDRAAINKAGVHAKTNFSIQDYGSEIKDLQAMPQTEMIAMLRSKARKVSVQTSHYRGVSLLKQTQKWHAQINMGGKQVHLGFYFTEKDAGKAYDRAAINKGARHGGRIITNRDIQEYASELELLRRVPQLAFVEILANEQWRSSKLALVSEGHVDQGPQIFGPAFETDAILPGVLTAEEILEKAMRAQPKPTADNPLYTDFGKPKTGTPPQGVARPPGRPPPLFRRRKALFHSEDDMFDENRSISDSDGQEREAAANQAPRRSARVARRGVRHYSKAEASDGSGESDSFEARMDASPERALTAPSHPWAFSSPSQRMKHRGPHRSMDEEAADIRPVPPPSWDLLAYAVAAAAKEPVDETELPANRANQAIISAVNVPSAEKDGDGLPRINSWGAATAGSRASADMLGHAGPQPIVVDKESQALKSKHSGTFASAATVNARDLAASQTPSPGAAQRPAVTAFNDRREQPGGCGPLFVNSPAAVPRSRRSNMRGGGSASEIWSTVPGADPHDMASILAGLGRPTLDKLSDAAVAERSQLRGSVSALESMKIRQPSGVEGSHMSQRALPEEDNGRWESRLHGAGETQQEKAKARQRTFSSSDSEDAVQAKVKPLTKRQKAMRRRRASKRTALDSKGAEDSDSKGLPAAASYAASIRPSPQPSVDARKGVSAEEAHVHGLQEDAASQCSPQLHIQRHSSQVSVFNKADGEGAANPSLPSPRREGGNQRKRKPSRSAI